NSSLRSARAGTARFGTNSSIASREATFHRHELSRHRARGQTHRAAQGVAAANAAHCSACPAAAPRRASRTQSLGGGGGKTWNRALVFPVLLPVVSSDS